MTLNGHTTALYQAELTAFVNAMRAARRPQTLRPLILPDENSILDENGQEVKTDWPALNLLNHHLGLVLERADDDALVSEEARDFWAEVWPEGGNQYGVSEKQLRDWWFRISDKSQGGWYTDQQLAELLGYETVDWYIPRAIAGVADSPNGPQMTIRMKPLWLRWRKPPKYKPKKAIKNYKYVAADGTAFTFEKATELASGILVMEGDDDSWYQIYEDRVPPFTRLQRAARIWLLRQLCHRKLDSSKDLYLFELYGIMNKLIVETVIDSNPYDEASGATWDTVKVRGLDKNAYDSLIALLGSHELQVLLMAAGSPGVGEPNTDEPRRASNET